MDCNGVDEKQPHLPKGASIPRNQVAGHKHEGRSKLGMLEHDGGSILKPLQKPTRGPRELRFYQQVFEPSCVEPDIIHLQNLMPKLYGTHQFEEYPEVKYMKLENIVTGFRHPCVIDIKMGKKTYDPEARPSKIAKKLIKCPHAETFGFQLTGMQTYDPAEQRTKFYDKLFCRKLGQDEVLRKGLGYYFNIKHGLRKDAIQVLLEKLYEIEKWFLTQRKLSFYASSLLLVYEGDMQQNDIYTPRINQCQSADCKCSNSYMHTVSTNSSDVMCDVNSSDTDISDMDTSSSLTASSSSISMNTQTTSGCPSLNTHPAVIADVKMIDFTHVFSVNEKDDNYLYGLQNLIANMKQLLAMDS